MRSIIAASVVDFPEPVGPVTRIKPRGRSDRSAITFGSLSSSKLLMLNGICRMTIETQPRCLKQLPRKRASCWMPNEKSSSSSISKRFFWFSVSTEYAICSVSLGCSTYCRLEFSMSPSTRSLAHSPAVMCRSEAPFWIISSRRTLRLMPWGDPPGGVGAGEMSGNVIYALVSRIICSIVVMPFITFSHASIRSVSMPSAMAVSLISVAPAFDITLLRTAGVMAITS